MKSLFRKSLTLALVAVLMSLIAGESTPGGADSGQQLAYHRCRPVEG